MTARPRPIRRPPIRKDLRDLARPAALFAFALLVTFLAWKFQLVERLPELQAWIRSFGPWGPLVFITLNALAVMLAMPAILFTLAAGALFGLVWGSLLAWAGGLAGAALAFLTARYVARDPVMHWVAGHPWMRHLEQRTERYDAILVVSTRILPIFPFNLVNYAWGLTSIRFVPYVVWTAVGKTPNFIFFVALGAASAEGLTRAQVSREVLWTLAAMALVMAAVSIWLRDKLKKR